MADLITLSDETINDEKPYELFDPEHTWKRKVIENFTSVSLKEKVFENGKFVGKERDIREVRDYCAAQIDTLWDEVTRFENPHNYYVDLSQKLWDEKNRLLESHKTR